MTSASQVDNTEHVDNTEIILAHGNVIELNFSKTVDVSSKVRLDCNRADWDKIRGAFS